MRKMAIGLLLGCLSALYVTELPHFSVSGIILLVSVFFSLYFQAVNRPILLFVVMVMCGASMTLLVSEISKRGTLPQVYEGQDLLVQGRISSLVDQEEQRLTFQLEVSDARRIDNHAALDWRGRIQLSAYRDLPAVSTGERWQFQVRLKRGSGLMNPGGFDYERWLFSQGIVAKGYLRKSRLHQKLSDAPWYSVNGWRADIRHQLNRMVKSERTAAVLKALMIADRRGVSVADWATFRETGTSHLMAISGLHVGLVAGLGLGLVYVIWWCFPVLNTLLPSRQAGAFIGVGLATCYALLAGMTVPTQRALLMVVVALVLLSSRKHFSASRVLAMVLVVVLLLDPLAVMSVGFFLSFAAVAIILWVVSRSMAGERFRLFRLQLFLSLLMLPIGLLFFGQGSLISPIANLIAIPWVSLVVVPFSFLALWLSYFSESLAAYLFEFLDLHLEGLLFVLSHLANLPQANVSMHYLPQVLTGLLIAAALLMTLPSGLTWRWATVMMIIPVLWYRPASPKQDGEFWLTVLDVGQGLSAVIETRDKTLVFDVGDRVSERYDMGKMVVLPFLRHQRVDKIDALVLSHDDRDHTGGASALFESLPINMVYANQWGEFEPTVNALCRKGVSWRWQQVHFEFLHPTGAQQGNDNNRSCVLRVSNTVYSVLLTADIQKRTEIALLNNQRDQLPSNVLLVPHHGSKTSSSRDFIAAVNPDWAIVSAGYRSRFRHPNPAVIERYKEQGVNMLQTASDGAILFKFSTREEPLKPVRYRAKQKGFWSR